VSLINDMLRDLAEREPRSAHTTPGIAVVPKAARHRPKSLVRLAFGVGLIAILLGASAWFARRLLNEPAQPHLRAAVAVPLHPLLPSPARLEPVHPAILTGAVRTRRQATPSKPSLRQSPVPSSVASVRMPPHPVHAAPLRSSHRAPDVIAFPQSSIEIAPTRPETPAREVSEDLASAERATHRGNWRRAIRDLGAALAINPDLESARGSLVRLDLAHGRITSAQHLLIQGIRLAKTRPHWRETALNWLARAGDAHAAWILSRRYAPHPLSAHPRYLTLEAALAQATDHWPAARTLYTRMTALQPDNAWAWAGLGIALDQLGQAPAALRADRKAVALGTLTSALTDYLTHRIHALDQMVAPHEPPRRP